MRMENDRELDIAKNLKLIEWLKSEILTSVAEIFRMLTSSVRFLGMGLQTAWPV